MGSEYFTDNREGFIRMEKQEGKMPFYTPNIESEKFRFEKMPYGLRMLGESGLFEQISII